MKKEALVLLLIALTAAVLLGVIYSNWKKDSPPSSGVDTVASVPVPTLNQRQQLEMLKEVLAREPDNRDAWVRLGHYYFDADQPMNAVDAYTKALELNGSDPDVLTDQGVMYRRLGWFEKAIDNFNRAAALNPRHQQSLYNLGIVYRYDLQDFDRAIEAWNRFVALDPFGSAVEKIQAEIDFMKQHPRLPRQPQ